MFVDCILHLCTADVFPAPDDNLFEAVKNGDVALIILERRLCQMGAKWVSDGCWMTGDVALLILDKRVINLRSGQG